MINKNTVGNTALSTSLLEQSTLSQNLLQGFQFGALVAQHRDEIPSFKYFREYMGETKNIKLAHEIELKEIKRDFPNGSLYSRYEKALKNWDDARINIFDLFVWTEAATDGEYRATLLYDIQLKHRILKDLSAEYSQMKRGLKTSQ